MSITRDRDGWITRDQDGREIPEHDWRWRTRASARDYLAARALFAQPHPAQTHSGEEQ